MTPPQIIALILLGIEVLVALSLGDEKKERSGKDLLLDALIWTSVLIWGGFWN